MIPKERIVVGSRKPATSKFFPNRLWFFDMRLPKGKEVQATVYLSTCTPSWLNEQPLANYLRTDNSWRESG